MSGSSSGYESHYNDSSFWGKLKKRAAKLGKGTVKQILTLYFCMIDSDTPLGVKTAIAGALGYFISPIDLIPDIAIGIGFTDDVGILGTTFANVLIHIKPEHQEKAEEKVNQWF